MCFYHIINFLTKLIGRWTRERHCLSLDENLWLRTSSLIIYLVVMDNQGAFRMLIWKSSFS